MKKNIIKKSVSSRAQLLPKERAACGGVLRQTRKGRQGARKLSTQHTMHLVLRSSKARGAWSFLRPQNKNKVKATIQKHAERNYIQLLSLTNVGNHLHIHFKLHSRQTYKPFIRAITGAIALQIMGANRNVAKVLSHKDRFWDYRPFTTFVTSFRHQLNTADYKLIHKIEGLGWDQPNAQLFIAHKHDRLWGLGFCT